eukprot:625542-Prorocentrum_minimum.AAC.3
MSLESAQRLHDTSVAELQHHVDEVELQTVGVFNFECFVLLILLQCGFMVLESGCVRIKNVRVMIVKNFMDFSAGA